MADERDEIRSRISIVDLVGQRVALKKAGKHWKGLCPFHDDRNPSFSVSEATGYYKCWSCGESGDIFTWVMKTQNLEFPEALRMLAKQAGVQLRSAASPKSASLAEAHRAIMEAAQRFFVEELAKSEAASAYCKSRGLSQDVLEEWGIGYAPDVGMALATRLKKAGLPLQEARTLFLVDHDSEGGFFDKFRGRLMFPIRDEKGDLLAFGGRLIGEGTPKYINSGDTPLYRKSRVLYGLDRAKSAISDGKTAVLVEGYLDVIACHRGGLRCAVASLGTALTEDHARLLRRWCESVAVLYDGDSAGVRAAERALDVLGASNLKARVALLPEGGDPDTLLRDGGPKALQEAVETARTPLEFRVARAEAALSPDHEDFWTGIVGALATSNSFREVERLATDLVKRLLPNQQPEAARNALLADVRRYRAKDKRRGAHLPATAVAAIAAESNASLSRAEMTLIKALVEESTRELAWPLLQEEGLFESDRACALAEDLRTAFRDEAPIGEPVSWMHRLGSEESRETIVYADQPHIRVNPEVVQDTAARLRKKREERKIAELKSQAGERDLESIMEGLKSIKPQAN